MTTVLEIRGSPLFDEVLNRISRGDNLEEIRAWWRQETGNEITPRTLSRAITGSGDPRAVRGTLGQRLRDRLGEFTGELGHVSQLLEAVLEDTGNQYLDLLDEGELSQDQERQKNRLGQQLFTMALELHRMAQKLGYSGQGPVTVNVTQVNGVIIDAAMITQLRDQMLDDFARVVEQHIAEGRGVMRLLRPKEIGVARTFDA